MNDLLSCKYSFNLIKKFVPSSNSLLIQKAFSKSFVVTEDLVGLRLKVYNGKDFLILFIVNDMVGHIIGEFVFTRSRYEFKKKKKKK